MADTVFLRLAAPVLTTLLLAAPVAAQPASVVVADPLAPARTHYNEGRFEEAIQAATSVEGTVGSPATLIIGRAGLERFRTTADPAQLAAARTALSHVDAIQLSPRDRLDLVVGLGEALFFDEHYHAAADLFESILADVAALGPAPRDQLLDWWATAVDRHVRGLAPENRAEAFDRLVARMEAELRKDPTSAAAAYWVSAASFARGNVDRAWDAAVAGWVRGIVSVDRGVTLRPDLDRLVRDAIIPERLRRLQANAAATGAGEVQVTEASLLAEWTLVKEQWARP
ncbi:MAG: hypothetical protein ABIT71_25810 [Vicinamibacteraceae bacterium]